MLKLLFTRSIKLHTILFLIISIAANSSNYTLAQKNKEGYTSLSLQYGFYKNNSSLYGGCIQVGSKISKAFGAGFGFEALKFKQIQGLYLPAYADLRVSLPTKGEGKIFLMAQPGYALHNSTSLVNSGYNTVSLSSTGGFFFGTGLGSTIKGKTAPWLSLRYCSYKFNFTTPVAKRTSSIGALVFNAGIYF